MVTKEFLESKEYATKREILQREINRNTYKPKECSYEKWKKSPEEKLQLVTAKINHKNLIRKAGFDPKKRLNLPEPVSGKVW